LYAKKKNNVVKDKPLCLQWIC